MVKAQLLADFVLECAIPEEGIEVRHGEEGFEDNWALCVDGSSSSTGCGVGLVLTHLGVDDWRICSVV